MMLLSPVAGRLTRTVGPKVTLIGGLAVIGAGVGLTYSAMPALIMAAVPVHQTGSANSLNALSRYLGTAFSSAVISIILTNLTTSLAGQVIPSLDAFRQSFAVGALAATAALVTAVFIPGRPRSVAKPETGPARTERVAVPVPVS